jgi:5-formyltetrahydrofolate cyclo-ligase
MIHLETPNLNQLQVNKMGIRESAYPLAYEGPYDLILVPGVVFARDGYRIGYGGGYYDYFLVRHPEALKIGVGFPLQLVEKLPHAAYDIPVDGLILGNRQLITGQTDR